MYWRALIILITVVYAGAHNRKRRGLEGPFSNGSVVLKKTINNSNVSITCRASNTSICVNGDYLSTLSIEIIEKLVFLDELGNRLDDCELVNKTDYKFFLGNFGNCASNIKEIGNQIVVNYSLCVVPACPPGVKITRDTSTTFEFSCIYERCINISRPVVNPLIKKLILKPTFQKGVFAVKIARYSNFSYSSLAGSNQVSAGERVYVGLSIKYGNWTGLILQVEKCWGTRTSNPSDNLRFYFIENSCAAYDPWYPGSNMIGLNYASYKAKFSFKAFIWTGVPISEQNIYVYCEVSICEPKVPNSNCTNHPECPSTPSSGLNGRRRRSADTSTAKSLVSLGPVNIMTESCEQKDLGCSYQCSLSRWGKAVCTCPSTQSLGIDGKTCQELDVSIVEKQKHEEKMIYFIGESSLYMGIMLCLGVCCVLFSVIFIVCRRKKNGGKLLLSNIDMM